MHSAFIVFELSDTLFKYRLLIAWITYDVIHRKSHHWEGKGDAFIQQYL